jgi:G3E family GTPase
VIPVSIVTGFLGSGKTTLIGRVLRDPAFARTAVIVNEFGEIGLDHELIAASNESFTALTTGCLCCAVRDDLVKTLLDLHANPAACYDRVLIETSGLADPAPILHALMTDRDVARDHVIDTVLTVVDTLFGATALVAHPEARRQVALADLLVFSKRDLADPAEELLAELAALNPGAERGRADGIAPAALFGRMGGVPAAALLSRLPDVPAASPFLVARHTDGVESFSLVRETPIPALALTLLFQALAEHCGPRLLRMKGIVAIREADDRPAVLHGVQHVFSPPVFLPAWPSSERTSRLLFITRGVPRYFPARLLDIIEAELLEEIDLRRRE